MVAREWPWSWGHHVTGADVGAADLTGDGGVDLGVGEVDVGHSQLCLRRRKLRCLRPLVGNRIIHCRALARGCGQQRLATRELYVGVGEAGRRIRDGGLLLGHRGLERRAFQPVQQVAVADFGPFGEQPLLEERRHAGGQRRRGRPTGYGR